jgi:predicted transcriptional regulator
LKHRSKEEIAALVLEAIVNTHRPSQTMIMYKAYLTHVQLKEFLASLVEKGLIEYHKLERIYTITDKGIHFLEVYNQLSQLHTSNILNTVATELQTLGPSERTNEQPSYLVTITRTNNRWKCEKCLVPFANLKLLKLHKVENHSY